MKNKTRILITVLSILAILLPFIAVISTAVFAPSQYDDTFFGELDAKVDRLYSIKENKIVVVGGSSVAFGLDSELLGKYMGMPVVNFGLYADLGTKLMLDLSEDAIKAGDIVVLAPELDPQTLSMYFSGSSTWKAFDDDPAMIRYLKSENISSMWGSLWGFTTAKLSYLEDGKPNPEGVYNSRNFNEYGDIVYTDGNGNDLRTRNILSSYYDSSTPINPDLSVFSSDFLDYLNDYIDRLTDRGATVCFSYCPMNRMALDTDGNGTLLGNGTELPTERIAAFETALAGALHCPVIGSFTGHLYLPNYFYDSNFHLNTAGVTVHTVDLVKNLFQQVYGREVTVKETIPEPPELTITAGDTETVYTDGDFLLQLMTSDVYAIVGVSEAGLAKETLLIPATFTGSDGIERTVSVLAKNAFSDCSVTKAIVIADTAEMLDMVTGCFDGSSVTELYLFCPVENFCPGQFLAGTSDDLLIYIGSEHYGTYCVNYFWESLFVTGYLRETTKIYSDFTSGTADTGNFQTQSNANGSVTITGLTTIGARQNYLVIPAEIDGKPVSAIAANSFSGSASLKTLVFDPEIVSITIAEGALIGSSVNRMILYAPETAVTVGSGLSGIALRIPGDLLAAYREAAGWSQYSENMMETSDSFTDWQTED